MQNSTAAAAAARWQHGGASGRPPSHRPSPSHPSRPFPSPSHRLHSHSAPAPNHARRRHRWSLLSYDDAMALVATGDDEIRSLQPLLAQVRTLAASAGRNVEATELKAARTTLWLPQSILTNSSSSSTTTTTTNTTTTTTTTTLGTASGNHNKSSSTTTTDATTVKTTTDTITHPSSSSSSLTATTTTAHTSAGFCNTDHIILTTGDARTDRVAELQRAVWTRQRAHAPEARGEERWDKPRAPGERRRRLARHQDVPTAPPEPPPSGYILFVGHLTTKLRHDRPHERHEQTKVVQEISILWRIGLTDADRQYYSDFSEQARAEYKQQWMEFRATGAYTPSTRFEKVPGVNLWFRKQWEEKNALEKELASYETYSFPPRPPEFDEAYKQREEASKLKRKLKLKGLLDEHGNPIGPIPEDFGRSKRGRRKKNSETTHDNDNDDDSNDNNNTAKMKKDEQLLEEKPSGDTQDEKATSSQEGESEELSDHEIKVRENNGSVMYKVRIAGNYQNENNTSVSMEEVDQNNGQAAAEEEEQEQEQSLVHETNVAGNREDKHIAVI